jgi:hypothetical protein
LPGLGCGVFWAVAIVDIAQAAIKKRASREKFEVMKKSDERPAGPFGQTKEKPQGLATLPHM